MWRKNLSRYVQAADEPAGADCPRGRPRGVRKRSGWNMKETGGCALCCFFLRRRRSINNMQIRRASATPYVDPLQHHSPPILYSDSAHAHAPVTPQGIRWTLPHHSSHILFIAGGVLRWWLSCHPTADWDKYHWQGWRSPAASSWGVGGTSPQSIITSLKCGPVVRA